jgi:hypothetical protein
MIAEGPPYPLQDLFTPTPALESRVRSKITMLICPNVSLASSLFVCCASIKVIYVPNGNRNRTRKNGDEIGQHWSYLPHEQVQVIIPGPDWRPQHLPSLTRAQGNDSFNCPQVQITGSPAGKNLLHPVKDPRSNGCLVRVYPIPCIILP